MAHQLHMYQLYRVKDTNIIFNSLQSAAIEIKKLTLNTDYKGRNMKRDYSIYKSKVENNLWKGEIVSRPTIFNEIECVHRPLTEKMLNLVKKQGRSLDINYKDLGILLCRAIRKFILDNWDSKKIHLMSHSSGYDSRTISAILNVLKNKYGEDWLGKLYFVCWEPEIKDFLKIAEYQKWPKENIILFDRGKTVDYYRKYLNFAFIGENYSEATRFLPQECIFNEVAAHLSSFDDIQVITANHCDEVMDMNWINYGHYFLRHLSDTSNKRNLYYQHLTPYTSYDVLNVLIKYNINAQRRILTKKGILDFIDPKLKEFVNFTPQKQRKKDQIPCELLSPGAVNKMESDFKKSWYFKTFKPAISFPFPKRVIYKDVRTKIYIKAAICEYLLKCGCIIRGD